MELYNTFSSAASWLIVLLHSNTLMEGGRQAARIDGSTQCWRAVCDYLRHRFLPHAMCKSCLLPPCLQASLRHSFNCKKRKTSNQIHSIRVRTASRRAARRGEASTTWCENSMSSTPRSHPFLVRLIFVSSLGMLTSAPTLDTWRGSCYRFSVTFCLLDVHYR